MSVSKLIKIIVDVISHAPFNYYAIFMTKVQFVVKNIMFGIKLKQIYQGMHMYINLRNRDLLIKLAYTIRGKYTFSYIFGLNIKSMYYGVACFS